MFIFDICFIDHEDEPTIMATDSLEGKLHYHWKNLKHLSVLCCALTYV